MNQISKNDAIQLYEQYETYLSTYIQDNIVNKINQNISGVMDACKQLFIFGTGSKTENAQDGIAIINVSYESMNVPTSTRVSQMIDLYTNRHDQGQNYVSIYDNLSSHYSRQAFNDDPTSNTNQGISYLTSDIIKLSFNEPVATSARVMTMINQASSGSNQLLKIHNNWATSSINVSPTWLNQMPHENLFNGVSTYINDSLYTHDTNLDAHKNLLSSYSTKAYVQHILTSNIQAFSNDLNDSNNTNAQNCSKLSTSISNIDYELYYHDKLTINEEGYGWAHSAIFDKYDRRWQVDKKDDVVRAQVSARFEQHTCISGGLRQHAYLASKVNPYLQGNIYLNCEDPNSEFNKLYNAQYNVTYGNDDTAHALYIKTSKNDFAKIGSYLTNTAADCGGLLIQTGDNGNQPIKIQQLNGTIAKNTAYILDSVGNTSFPNKMTARNINLTDINGNSIIEGKVTINNKTIINNAQFKNRSTINLHNLPSSDSSLNIPNTQWVHMTVSGLAKLFAVSGLMLANDVWYHPLVPCTGKIDKNFVQQKFGYLKNIQMNPYNGGKIKCNTISGASLIGNNGTINNITANNITSNIKIYANQIKATNNISGKCFYGTDKDGYQLNERSKVKAIASKQSVGDARDIDYPLVAIKPENSSYFNGYTVKNSKHQLVYAQTNSTDKKYPLSFNPYTNTINAETFYGTANRARWADLAEIYQTDMEYPIGTLVQFGGQKQLTAATTKINGVISDKPAYLMNSNAKGQPIALIGRVTVRVIGKINKFDYIGLSDINGVGIAIGTQYADKVIGIALQTNNSQQQKLVLCSVQLHL